QCPPPYRRQTRRSGRPFAAPAGPHSLPRRSFGWQLPPRRRLRRQIVESLPHPLLHLVVESTGLLSPRIILLRFLRVRKKISRFSKKKSGITERSLGTIRRLTPDAAERAGESEGCSVNVPSASRLRSRRITVR